MAEEPTTVEAVTDAATAKVEAAGAIVAAAEAKDTAGEAADAAIVAATAADAAVAAAANAEAIAADAATRDAALRIEAFQAELGTCRTEIASLKSLVTALSESNVSTLATLTKLAWLGEVEAMTEPETKPAGDTSDLGGGKKTATVNFDPAPEIKVGEGADAHAPSTRTADHEQRPAAGANRKLRWL